MLRLSKNRVGRVRPGGVEAGPVAALVVILFGLLLATNGGSGPTVAQAVMPTDAPPFPNGWVWQNPLPQGFDLYGVTCPTDQGCYAVGVSGTVVASSPATGGHWQTQSSGTTQNLTNVDCVSAGVCVAVGTGGTIRRTTNAGQSWSPAPITTTANLGVLNCLPDGTCYTYDTNGNLFKSSDSGASWASTYYTSSTPTGLSCPDAANCYLLFGDGFSKTTDGGQTWASTPITFNSNPYYPYLYTLINCPTLNVCYLINSKATDKRLGPAPYNWTYQVLKTIDGGQSWTGVFHKGIDTGIGSIYCSTSSNCYGIGSTGFRESGLYVTNDGGTTWASHSFPGFGELLNNTWIAPKALSCSKTNSSICNLVGSQGLIYKSSNNGQNWQYGLDGPQGQYLTNLSCVDTANCYILDVMDSVDTVGKQAYTYTLASKTNTANSWITSTTLIAISGVVASMSCPVLSTCYASTSTGLVYKTIDSGQTWISYTTGVTNYVTALSCPSAFVCYGKADSGRIIKTANGGLDWSVQIVSSTNTYGDLNCPELNTCYTGGEGLFKTTDGGQSWTYLTHSVEISNAPPIVDLSCPTASTCYAIRNSSSSSCSYNNPPSNGLPPCNSLIKTQDGGATWDVLSVPRSLDKISCPDPLNCYATDYSFLTRIIHTFDGGANWSIEGFAPFAGIIYEVNCPRTCTAIGNNLAIVSNNHPVAQDLANLRVSLPTTARPGEPTSFTVQARTVSDTMATAYTGTVRFSSTDLAAGLPSEYTFQPGDAGTHTFTTTFNTTGTQVLSANDTYYSQLIKGSAVTGVAVCLPSVVTQPTDNGNDNCGSLSYALKDAATSTSPVYTITFQGVPTVTVNGPLPVISSTNATTRISLDGGCTNGGPGVTIQGAITGTVGSATVDGLRLKDRVSLNGLQVVGFSGYGISLEGDNNELSCNRIGPGDGNNLTDLANGGGLRIGRSTNPGVTASHNRLGRVGEPSSGNSIAGNLGVGLMVEAGQDNALYYTLIGLSSDGQAVLRNKGGALMVSPGTGLRFGPGNRLQV